VSERETLLQAAERRGAIRVRFRLTLTIIPPVIGAAVVVVLWGERGEEAFFDAAAHVIALGAIGLAIQGRFFRLQQHISGGFGDAYAILNVIMILIATGVGLFFAFRALAVGHSGPADLAMTSAALATLVAAFAVQAMFGTPGVVEDEEAG
jgi:succinate dehydrogenase/fumarate reductase flavoprotein subunit